MNYQCKCGSIDMFTKKQGNNIGLYCKNCGKWQKWINKNELRAFEYNKTSKTLQTEKTENIIKKLEIFAKNLDDAIDKEMAILPISESDAIRKSSYCLGLERCKNTIYDIINGNK